MCQSQVAPGSTVPEAIEKVHHGACTLEEQLENAARVARAHKRLMVARDLELLAADARHLGHATGRLFSQAAREWLG